MVVMGSVVDFTTDADTVVPGIIVEDELQTTAMPDEIQQINSQATELLRSHASAFVAQNGHDATYLGWIAMLHPENVRVDERLMRDGCDHQKIFQEALQIFSSSHPTAADTSKDAELSKRLQAEEFAASAPFAMGSAAIRVAEGCLAAGRNVFETTERVKDQCVRRAPRCVRAAAGVPFFFGSMGLRASECGLWTSEAIMRKVFNTLGNRAQCVR